MKKDFFDALRKIMDIDAEKGKIFWPIKEGDCPSPNDAYATLYALSDGEININFYDKTGNKLTNELSVSILNMSGESPGHFWHVPLKKLLEDEYDETVSEKNVNSPRMRLLARLIKAFDEPTAPV